MSLVVLPRQMLVDPNGTPRIAAELYFYESGTTTPITTYTTGAYGPTHPNPVPSVSSGFFPAIHINPAVNATYKIVAKDAAGSTIWTEDNVPALGFAAQDIGTLLYPLTDAEEVADVTPANFAYPPGDPRRYGAIGDGVTNDTATLATGWSANTATWGMDLGGLTYVVSSTLPASPLPAGFRCFNGEISCPQVVIPSIDRWSVTAWGAGALSANTFIPEQHAAGGGIFYASGNHIVAIGTDALKANTTGRRMTAVGSRALLSNTSGYYNTAIGSHALEQCTSGYENTALGVQALQFLTTGDENIGVGPLAFGLTTTGNQNVGVGRSAGRDNLTGSGNTYVGHQAGLTVTSSNNVAMGHQALSGTTSGDRNTAVGATAAGAASTASQVCAFGYRSLLVNTANNNTGCGTDTLISNTSGTKNAAFGYNAGSITVNGNNNTFLGADSTMSAADWSNTTNLGYQASSTGNNQVTLGNSSIATLRCQVTSITALSDVRFKFNIKPLNEVVPESFISDVEIVAHEWKDEKMPRGVQMGVIAQQLDEAASKHGLEWMGLVDKTNPDRWEATPGKLLFPLIVEFQRLQRRVAELERERDDAKALWGRM